jgi:hypothetical protein
VAQVPIDEVDSYPVSYFWELVEQGVNKGNMVSGGGLKLQSQESEEEDSIERVRKRIAEDREKGKWPKA